MRFALPIAALLTAALAAPTPGSPTQPSTERYYLPLTVTLFNDVTGAHAAAGIDTSGHFRVLGWDLFRNSAVARDGEVIATSMQLSFPDLPLPDGYSCGVSTGGWQNVREIGRLDAKHTYLDLDGVPDKAVETDVTDWIINCDIYIVNQV